MIGYNTPAMMANFRDPDCQELITRPGWEFHVENIYREPNFLQIDL